MENRYKEIGTNIGYCFGAFWCLENFMRLIEVCEMLTDNQNKRNIRCELNLIYLIVKGVEYCKIGCG